jgi:hypothetical protein
VSSIKKTAMKKPSHASIPPKEISSRRASKAIAPLEDPVLDNAADEPNLAADQFAVVAREEEAASSGHRVEPIEEDDEHNAEKLVEEGLHGFLRASPNKSRKAR